MLVCEPLFLSRRWEAHGWKEFSVHAYYKNRQVIGLAFRPISVAVFSSFFVLLIFPSEFQTVRRTTQQTEECSRRSAESLQEKGKEEGGGKHKRRRKKDDRKEEEEETARGGKRRRLNNRENKEDEGLVSCWILTSRQAHWVTWSGRRRKMRVKMNEVKVGDEPTSQQKKGDESVLRDTEMRVNQSTRERRRELERATRHRNAGQLSRPGNAAPRTLQVKIITPWLSTPLLLSRELGEGGVGVKGAAVCTTTK